MKQYDASKVRVFWGDVELKGAADGCVIDETRRRPGLLDEVSRALREPEGLDDAQARLAAIVAELERLEPGCTRLHLGTAFVEPVDRSLEHAVSLDIASDSHRYSVCECGFSWAAVALTYGGGPLPDGESAVDTAQRLLADARRP